MSFDSHQHESKIWSTAWKCDVQKVVCFSKMSLQLSYLRVDQASDAHPASSLGSLLRTASPAWVSMPKDMYSILDACLGIYVLMTSRFFTLGPRTSTHYHAARTNGKTVLSSAYGRGNAQLWETFSCYSFYRRISGVQSIVMRERQQ